jgi:hypothetical protein
MFAVAAAVLISAVAASSASAGSGAAPIAYRAVTVS